MSIEEQRRSMFEDKFGKILAKEKAGDLHTAFSRDSDGRYFRNYVHAAWLFWNAALDSIEIELPPQIPATTEWNKGYNTGLARASEAISACLKVKL